MVREAKKRDGAQPQTADQAQRAGARQAASTSHTVRQRCKLTHPDRVYWDDVGVTKRDLADYYAKVWDWMAPHVVGRVDRAGALSRRRRAANASSRSTPRAGIATEFLHLVPEKGDKIISIDDLDGLISLVQARRAGDPRLAARPSTTSRRPTAWCSISIRARDVTWNDVIAAAREVRERLARIKLESFVKTTGGKGLHVVLPIKPAPWDERQGFLPRGRAQHGAGRPRAVTSPRAIKARRNNRIFVDYLRNSREATAIAPYSTRARPGAPVSVPIDWSELGALKGANQYTVQNVMQRMGTAQRSLGRHRPRQTGLPKFK